MAAGYNYSESGIERIWLRGGYTETPTKYGPGLSIKDFSGLHAAITAYLIDRPSLFNGETLRFLRLELDVSMEELAVAMGVDADLIQEMEREADRPLPMDIGLNLRDVASRNLGIEVGPIVENAKWHPIWFDYQDGWKRISRTIQQAFI